MKRLVLSTLAFTSMALNAQNIVEVTMKDGEVKTYQTTSLENIKFGSGNNFSIINDEGETIEFNGTASNIRFKKNHHIDGTSVHTIAHSIGLGWNLGNILSNM